MHKSTERLAKKLQSEIDVMALIRESPKIPVVFGFEKGKRGGSGRNI